MECPECHSMIPDKAKFCNECGAKLITPGSAAKIEDSVVARSPGAGSNYAPVINVLGKEQKNIRCAKCDNEITSKNKSLLCFDCGKLFCEHCETFYRETIRKPGEKPYCSECFKKLHWRYPPVTVGVEKPETITVRFDEGSKVKGKLLVGGGNNDIHFYVKDPIGNILLEKKRVKSNYEFSIVPKMYGPLTMYFDNTFSAVTTKKVVFEYWIQ